MKRQLSYVLPQKFKHRLFVAFVLLIVFPLIFASVYNYKRFEEVIRQNTIKQSHDQVNRITESLQEFMQLTINVVVSIEQDSRVTSMLKKPENYDLLEKKYQIEDKFKSINNSFFLTGPRVYFQTIDFHGNVYTSYQPKRTLNYSQITEEKWYTELRDNSIPYKWGIETNTYVSSLFSTSPKFLTFYAVLKDTQFKPYGVARVSIEFLDWFNVFLQKTPEGQSYFIVSSNGDILASSNKIAASDTNEIVSETISRSEENGYYSTARSFVNYSHISSIDCYLISTTPNAALFSMIYVLKKNFFIFFSILCFAFLIVTYLLSSTITKPLRSIQFQMANIVQNKLKVHLPESKVKGEIYELTRTFNRMVDDMNTLVKHLKMEERQKETIHFQMLLAQINPHFLLNTLNTIKWIALRKEDIEIEEICIALGKLLETSLNSEVELIHLKKELELVESYVHIQKFRFKNRIEISVEKNDVLDYALVPKLSLQPLVENAYNHGFHKFNLEGHIKIKAYIENENLLIDVEDNGAGLKQAALFLFAA